MPQYTRGKSDTGAKSIAGGRLVPQHTKRKSETGAKSIAGGRLVPQRTRRMWGVEQRLRP